ncbi:hypothetical protein MPQ_2656 [Methylovorus sp. MP688]|nr:hypothetical protein MPQ_2656 [Methylovorus sp. MP688]
MQFACLMQLADIPHALDEESDITCPRLKSHYGSKASFL